MGKGHIDQKIIKGLLTLFVMGIVIFSSSGVYADLTKQDIEEIRKIVKEEVQALREEMQKEFGYVNKRIDDVNKRIDDVNKRIDDVRSLLYVMLAGIFTLVGFIIWDRRTAISPAVKKMNELEEKEEKISRALKEFALREPRLAESLRYAGVM
ncbi:MAG: hypothetical protein AB1414_00035 [bacterium]